MMDVTTVSTVGVIIYLLGGLGAVLLVGFLASSAVYWVMNVSGTVKQSQRTAELIEHHYELISDLKVRVAALEARLDD